MKAIFQIHVQKAIFFLTTRICFKQTIFARENIIKRQKNEKYKKPLFLIFFLFVRLFLMLKTKKNIISSKWHVW